MSKRPSLLGQKSVPGEEVARKEFYYHKYEFSNQAGVPQIVNCDIVLIRSFLPFT